MDLTLESSQASPWAAWLFVTDLLVTVGNQWDRQGDLWLGASCLVSSLFPEGEKIKVYNNDMDKCCNRNWGKYDEGTYI